MSTEMSDIIHEQRMKRLVFMVNREVQWQKDVVQLSKDIAETKVRFLKWRKTYGENKT